MYKLFLSCTLAIGLVIANATPAAAATTKTTTKSVLPAICQTVKKSICVVKSKGSRATLYAVQNKKVVKSFAARTGDARGKDYVTTVGVHEVFWKHKDHVSSIYKSAMPYSMFFNGGQAVHYSSDFAKRGYNGSSHGCVNLNTLSGAKWLYNWTPTGTRLVVTR